MRVSTQKHRLRKGKVTVFLKSRRIDTGDSGGKPRVVEKLKREFGFKSLVMIGDGITDMEAKPPADLFIGYGGVVCREPVRLGADHFITSHHELLDALSQNPC